MLSSVYTVPSMGKTRTSTCSAQINELIEFLYINTSSFCSLLEKYDFSLEFNTRSHWKHSETWFCLTGCGCICLLYHFLDTQSKSPKKPIKVLLKANLFFSRMTFINEYLLLLCQSTSVYHLTDFAAPKSSTARNILPDYTYHLRVKLARIRAEHKEKETLSGWQP